MPDYEFNVVLDGAYPNVPYAPKRKSNYIDLPNENFDPVVGQHVLEDLLETMISLDGLGFDGVIVTEQHNGPIGSLGNPMLAAAYVAARTQRIRIGVVGPLINDYLTPLRLAEEISTLDAMTRGRLFFGLPLGHGMQHHSTGVMNPGRARRRLLEAHELLVAAFTRPGPFEWQGEFFHVPYVNLWPKPLQQPYPPVFVPGGGSVETLSLVAKYRYTYQAALSPRPALLRTAQKLRECCEEEGYEMDPRQLALVVSVHVAETDAQARREVEAHELWAYQNFFRSPMHDNFPPGYVSEASLRRSMAGGYRSTPISELTYDQIIEQGWLVAGSPETVANQLAELLEEMGAARLVLGMNPGSKPRWLAQKSTTLFAEEVIPRLRPGGVRDEAIAGYRTSAEYGARRPRDVPTPTASLGAGGLVDVATAHVPELREQLVEPWPPQLTTDEDDR
jgi:alkanesulfonate monooxygenase SsuD/methylene tetrahydromethanopterin reductase-like flavin-dependent oxidoreductase (luciferase family)